MSPDPENWMPINHSCDPNEFFNMSDLTLIALKDIQENDELKFFYPSTEWDMIQPFECSCNNSECLGRIAGARYLEESVLNRHILNPHILKMSSKALV